MKVFGHYKNNKMNYNNPYIKVEWEDTPENLTQERIKRVKEYFKHKYNTNDVKIIPKNIGNTSNITLKSLDTSDNIHDFQYQKKLIKEFLKENKVEIEWDLVNRLDNKVNGEFDKQNENRVKYNKWFIKRIEFSNFLSFGDNNVIDFTELNGITVIESNPVNFGGKTTLSVDLLMFLFFNKTTKTKTNGDIFNQFRDCDLVQVKGYVEIDGIDYIIQRKISRKKSKSGEYTVKYDLDYTKILNDGTIVNLEGEQRGETEKIITTAIGTEDDFLSTILTTGNNMEELIDSKPTARGQILTRFLGLDILKQKEEICKSIYNDWSKTLISNTYNKVTLELNNNDYESSIEESENKIVILKENLAGFDLELKTSETRRDTLLESKNNDIDKELMSTNPETLKREIELLILKQTEITTSINLIEVIEPSEYYLEDDHDLIKEKIREISVLIGVEENKIKTEKELILQLETGSICPTCKRSLEEVDHTKEIEDHKKTVIKLEKQQEKRKSDKLKLEESEKKFINLKKVYDEYEKNKLRKTKLELEFDQKQLERDTKQGKIDKYDMNKKKLDENQRIDGEITILRSKIETINGDIRQTNISIEKENNNIINLKEKIKVNLELIKKIKVEEELIGTFKVYLSVFGKNGISKVIIKNMIPLLNQELHRVLSDSCLFVLDLIINEKNELEFLMIDNETRVVKPLSSGSGYEKTISSLAIRSILTKVSTLPKPNIVVMDECFGKVGNENLELVGEFIKKIKNYFENIFVISHNPLIRGWADNVIIVKKDDNISSIETVNIKYS